MSGSVTYSHSHYVAGWLMEIANSQLGRGISRIGNGLKEGGKLHYVYYLLAALDLIAISGGLYLGHKIADHYKESVEINQTWSRRTNDLVELSNQAQVLNAPGKDALVSKNTRLHLEQFYFAYFEFISRAQRLRHLFGEAGTKDAVRHMDAIIETGLKMSAATIPIFDYMSVGLKDMAVAQMADMDKRYADLTTAVGYATIAVQFIQSDLFSTQLDQVDALRRYEFILGAAILLIVCCVALFGHWISVIIKRSNEEKELAAEHLRAVNEDVTNLNVALSNNLLRLRDAQDEIVRKGRLAQLGQLTATVAHEIRNPLGAIKTSVQLIARKVKDQGLEIEKPLERINNGITRCDRIITELLDFTRSNALDLRAGEFDSWLKATVDEEVKDLHSPIELKYELGLGSAQVKFEMDRMRRVVVNLVSNAAEAMIGKKGAKIAQVTQSPRMLVKTRLRAGNAELIVQDNGPGISEENLRKILEPLFTTKSFGVGLGLPAVEKILEMHGGGLKVESKLGQGAKFTAWFPIDPSRSERHARRTVAAA